MTLCGFEQHGTELKTRGQFFSLLTQYAQMNPDFLIRIHSGENKNDKDGIKSVLKMIKKEYDGQKDVVYPKIRIGHAIYGMDLETIELMKEMGVSIELNLASNLRLNNLSSLEDSVLKNTVELCKENGIPIFLGTDGHRIYNTTVKDQRELAQEAGIDLVDIIYNENKYILDRFNDIERERISFSNNADSRAKNRLRFKLKRLGIKEIQTQDAIGLKGKIPIVVAGSSIKTRGEGKFKEYKKIELAFQTLANLINPSKAYFVTGGTNCGPERLMHAAINKRNNSKSNSKIRCVGVIPSYLGRVDDDNALNDFSKIERDTITDGLIIDSYAGWDDFAEKLLIVANNAYNVKEKGPEGMAIFIGGGETLKTQIRLANKGGKNNNPISSFIYDGFEGSASSEFKKQGDKSDDVFFFSDVKDLIKNIYQAYGKEIFIKDFDIEKLPLYIQKAIKDEGFNYELIADTLIGEGKLTVKQMNFIKKSINEGESKEDILGTFNLDEISLKDIGFLIDAYLEYYIEATAPEIPENTINDVKSSEVLDVAEKLEKLKEDKNKKQDKNDIKKEGDRGE